MLSEITFWVICRERTERKTVTLCLTRPSLPTKSPLQQSRPSVSLLISAVTVAPFLGRKQKAIFNFSLDFGRKKFKMPQPSWNSQRNVLSWNCANSPENSARAWTHICFSWIKCYIVSCGGLACLLPFVFLLENKYCEEVLANIPTSGITTCVWRLPVSHILLSDKSEYPLSKPRARIWSVMSHKIHHTRI